MLLFAAGTIPQSLSATNGAPSASQLTADTVIIRVNGEAITQGEIDKRIATHLQRTHQPALESPRMAATWMIKKTEEMAITEILTSNVIASHTANVPDQIVANRIEQRRQQIPEGTTLEAVLEQQNQSLEELEEEIRKEIVRHNLIEQHTADLPPVTEAEALAYYKEHPIRYENRESASANHIQISFEEGESEESKAQKKFTLGIIRNEIIASHITFEEAAEEYSNCPSASHGGFLGELQKDQLIAELDSALFEQELNAIGKVIETPVGCHIIRVNERHEAGIISFDEVKEQIMADLKITAQDKVMRAYLKNLYDNATIERFGPND
ncbi:peptidylprolyl isomerase [Coraliomargarita sp. W4R53]